MEIDYCESILDQDSHCDECVLYRPFSSAISSPVSHLEGSCYRGFIRNGTSLKKPVRATDW